MARGGQHARGQIVIQVGLRRGGFGLASPPFAKPHDAAEFVGADQRVHLGQLFPDVRPVALHQAARHDQLLRLAGLLVRGHFENRVDRFLLGRVDETAGVDDEHVGLVRVGGELMPARGELAHHDLAIDQVFGASKTDKTDFQGVFPGDSFTLPHPRKSLRRGMLQLRWPAGTGPPTGAPPPWRRPSRSAPTTRRRCLRRRTAPRPPQSGARLPR